MAIKKPFSFKSSVFRKTIKKRVPLNILRGYLFYKLQIQTFSSTNIILIIIIIIIIIISVVTLIETGSDNIQHFIVQLRHITLKNVELLKYFKIRKLLQHVSVYKETIIREPQPVCS